MNKYVSSSSVVSAISAVSAVFMPIDVIEWYADQRSTSFQFVIFPEFSHEHEVHRVEFDLKVIEGQ